ncbi:hypothetical protein IWQ62_006893 [Dispira parvispora]|uniref:Uncharacterized protein n=1 Tax=Dispira parvispora TaxID=1520584 RepID=A0A9W8E3W7_9FUNG|nr:hypothetical protein IWQ62_006893 [Dispira parvispora]
MDQRELYAFTAHAIQDYDTDRMVSECIVTGIANLLLDCADKDGRHGYLRKCETIFRPIKPHTSQDEAEALCAYKADYYRAPFRDGELLRVIHAEEEREVLIVSCKSDHECTGRSVDQIRAYMNFAEFPAGLLLSQRRAFFFFQGKDDKEGIQPGPEFSDISNHVPEIADIIRGL